MEGSLFNGFQGNQLQSEEVYRAGRLTCGLGRKARWMEVLAHPYNHSYSEISTHIPI